MHRASTVARAVTAGSVDLAVVLRVEVNDVDMAATVVLNDLVGGMVSSTADDISSTVALDGDGVFTDVLEPDEFQCARAQTVDTLPLISSDDDVAQCGTILENKDSVGLACTTLSANDSESVSWGAQNTSFALAAARNTTVVLDPTSIKNLSCSNILRLAETFFAGVSGKTILIA